MAKRPASEREEDYKRLAAAYVSAVGMARQWSQSEIGRRMGVHPSTANKILKRKHAVDYAKLMVLADQARMPIPEELTAAAKAMSEPVREASPAQVEAFLASSPEMRRLVELGRQYTEAVNQETKREIKRKMEELIAKVA